MNALMGTGGNNVPVKMETIPKVYDVNVAKELDRANTLDTSCRGVWGKQNGTVIYSLEGNGSRESHHDPGFTNSDKMYTLNTVEHHAVAYCMGHDERSAQFEKNKTDPLTASDYKQPPIVAQMSTTGGQMCWSASKADHMAKFSKNIAGALMATDWKDAPVLVTENKQLEVCALTMDEDSTDKT